MRKLKLKSVNKAPYKQQFSKKKEKEKTKNLTWKESTEHIFRLSEV